MFEFIRGNKDSLEGRASLYVHNTGRFEEKREVEYPVLHVGQSFLDMFFNGELEGSEEEVKEREKKDLRKTTKKNW